MRRAPVAVLVLLAALCVIARCQGDVLPEVRFSEEPGKLRITVGGQPFGTYVFKDPDLPRPYFASLQAPGGIPVTRAHPPVPGQDPTDHADFHPGLWLAFGDLSGADSWRLKAPVRHEGFAEPPRGGRGRGTFTVTNAYLAADGQTALLRETCRYTLLARSHGYLLISDSTFRAEKVDAVFGDQEEMGLGLRVATSLTAARGGRIRDSDGRENEAGIRGRQPLWADYSGRVDGKQAGIAMMPDPKNPLRCWFHARDYGLLVANPFAGRALGGGEPTRVVVKPGEALRLRFGVLLHASPPDAPIDLPAAYEDFLRQLE